MPRPDRDLLPPPPRELPPGAIARSVRYQLRSSVMAWIGGFFLAIGLLFAAIFIPMMVREKRLATEGARSEATILAKRAYTERDSDGDRRRVHELELEFRLPDGRVWSASKKVGRSKWNEIREGDRLEVRYDPEDPARNMLPAAPDRFWKFFAPIFPGIFVLIGFLMFRVGWREITTPARLFRHGGETAGEVTGTSIVANERINKRNPTRIHYTYRDPFGTEHEGALKTMDQRLIDRASPGTTVTVLFDPKRPDRSTLLSAMGVDDPRLARRSS